MDNRRHFLRAVLGTGAMAAVAATGIKGAKAEPEKLPGDIPVECPTEKWESQPVESPSNGLRGNRDIFVTNTIKLRYNGSKKVYAGQCISEKDGELVRVGDGDRVVGLLLNDVGPHSFNNEPHVAKMGTVIVFVEGKCPVGSWVYCNNDGTLTTKADGPTVGRAISSSDLDGFVKVEFDVTR